MVKWQLSRGFEADGRPVDGYLEKRIPETSLKPRYLKVYAAASLISGDDVKTLQENLGHSTAAMTLNVYTHVTEQTKKASAARMDIFAYIFS